MNIRIKKEKNLNKLLKNEDKHKNLMGEKYLLLTN